MAYCTIADVVALGTKQKVARLANDTAQVRSDSDADTVLAVEAAQTVIQTEIDNYAVWMNLRLRGHIDISDTDQTSQLERMNAYGALYYLEVRRGKDGEAQNNYYLQHQQNEKDLKELQKRSLHTGVSPEHPAARTVSNKAGATRTFGSGTGSATEYF